MGNNRPKALSDEIASARRVIKDLYGPTTEKTKILFKKLEECKTSNDINKVLIWGRTNLL